MPNNVDTSSPTPPKLTEVFEALRQEADDAAATGRTLYGAQAKKHLRNLYTGFSESTYGFRKFIELLEAGDDAGAFKLEDVGGHPVITAQRRLPGARRQDPRRLKPDLWHSLVTWDSGLRLWDRKQRRAIFLPTDANGVPAWQTTPDQYLPIDPITMAVQIAWMHTFAETQDEPVQVVLLRSLKESAQGAFKKALEEVHCANAWRTYLHQRVLDHATEWAARSRLSPAVILEQRDHGKAPSANKAQDVALSPSSVELPKVDPVAVRRVGGSSDADDLRSLLHLVIDQMSFAELAALPIPAAYLLKR